MNNRTLPSRQGAGNARVSEPLPEVASTIATNGDAAKVTLQWERASLDRVRGPTRDAGCSAAGHRLAGAPAAHCGLVPMPMMHIGQVRMLVGQRRVLVDMRVGLAR
jgi:hypothetical protein